MPTKCHRFRACVDPHRSFHDGRVFVLAAMLVLCAPDISACGYSKYGFEPGDSSQTTVDELFRGVHVERANWKTADWRSEVKAIEDSATDIPGKLDLAWALHMANQRPAAGAIYREILEADPDNYEALCSYATVLHMARQYPRAKEMLSRAIALKPGFRNRAEEYHLAMIEYEETVQQNPQYAREHLFLDELTPFWENHKGVEENLSTVEFPEGYNSKGVAELLREFPHFGEGWHVLGMLLEHEEDFSMAAKAYDRALERGTPQGAELKRYMATFREFGRSMDPARVGGRRLVTLMAVIVGFLVLAWLLKFVSGIVADITNARAEKKNAERRERRKHKDPDAPL